MTVKSLIEKLKEFPEDMDVVTYEWVDIYDVDIEYDHNQEKNVVMVN